jgi:hypothetical protein
MMHVDLQLLMNLLNNKYGATLPCIDSQDQIEIDCCFLIDAFVCFLPLLDASIVTFFK